MYYENFENLCKINNLKPSQVSKATGIHTATLTSWKQGKYTPKPEKLQLIADFFNVSIDYIVTGSKKEKPDIPPLMPEQFELLELYSKLKDEQKTAIMNLLRSFSV